MTKIYAIYYSPKFGARAVNLEFDEIFCEWVVVFDSWTVRLIDVPFKDGDIVDVMGKEQRSYDELNSSLMAQLSEGV